MKSSQASEMDRLEAAMRSLMQIMKRPSVWSAITERAGVNIDRPSAAILMILMNYEPAQCRLSDLATKLSIEAPSVTRKVQQLELAGYVVRRQSDSDHRSFGLHVTAEGRAVADLIHQVQRENVHAALAGWPKEDRLIFIDLFERFAGDIASQYQLIKQSK